MTTIWLSFKLCQSHRRTFKSVLALPQIQR